MTDLQLKQPREGDRVAYKSDIDGLREYVAWSERRLDEKIDGLAHRLDEKVDNVATRLDQKIDNVATQLNQKLDLRFDSLAKQIQIFSWVGGGIATIMASAILLLISRSL